MSEIFLYATSDTRYSSTCAWGVVLEFMGKRSQTYYKILKGSLSEEELEICAIIHGMGKVKNKKFPLKIVTNSESLIEWQGRVNKSMPYKDTKKEFQLHGELYKYRDWLLDKMGEFNGVEVVSWEKLDHPHIDKESILKDVYDIENGG